MKKTFLFRLFALAFFCLGSLAIKSETSSCKVQCCYAAQKTAVMQSLILDGAHEGPIHHDDGFFIKI